MTRLQLRSHFYIQPKPTYASDKSFSSSLRSLFLDCLIKGAISLWVLAKQSLFYPIVSTVFGRYLKEIPIFRLGKRLIKANLVVIALNSTNNIARHRA
ncbi:hypothetical protein [Coleofasciculus sp. FACHB-SPT36]|uniref:hypothetical protein n=1 Tax=Cyanophyceae TaxID=3028117 RepID=UPI00168A4886|nr:hypothetical protein [Coleofasciculus sp. FACHB-SPT36]MBD2540853.1 hypothetical protein [Coleofasciculus sp. FACHB-SPT36]